MTYYSPKSPGRPEEVPWSIAREGKGGEEEQEEEEEEAKAAREGHRRSQKARGFRTTSEARTSQTSKSKGEGGANPRG